MDPRIIGSTYGGERWLSPPTSTSGAPVGQVGTVDGTLIDGKEFDSTLNRSRPATFALKSVIKGWSEALQLMPVASKWQLFVPSELAYGLRGARGTIGPNAALIFEVELLSIKEKAQASQPPPEGATRHGVARQPAAP